MEMLAKFHSRLLEVRTKQATAVHVDQKEEVEGVGGKDEDAETRKRRAEESTEGEGDDPALGDSTW